jgi:hypothetical protein
MTDDPIGRLETDESPAVQQAWNEPPDSRRHGRPRSGRYVFAR